MSPEPYICELDPDTKTTLKLYLFKNVQNVETIRQNVINGAWRCAAVKPSLVLAPLQVAVAANRAALSARAGALVTKTVYSEILYNLSLSKKITQSLTKFGIEKGDKILLCFLANADEDASVTVIPQIEGELCAISELDKFTDVKDIQSVYKLDSLKGQADFLDVIVSRMVTKNIVSH